MLSKRDMRRAALLHRVQAGLASDLDAALEPVLVRTAHVAGYLATGHEPAITPRPGWLLPVLLPDGDLDWAVSTGEYVENHFGIREPAGPRLGPSAIAGCDVVLVPALRVDRQGNRLGRGGGSYDRALRRATGLTVALLHDGELVDEVPAEEHDVRVAAAATPSLGVVHLPVGSLGQ